MEMLLEAYCDYITDNWDLLHGGVYQKIESRPKISYREPLTDELIALNAPDLSKDEELLAKLD